MKLTPQLRQEYQSLWDSMTMTGALSEALTIAESLGRHKDIYAQFGPPWEVIAVIHEREGSGSFQCSLKDGHPIRMSDWEAEAQAVVNRRKWDDDWSIPSTLYRIEAYNGMGYRLSNHGLSPYLWSFSNHYVRGKYDVDGHFNPTLIDKQVGAAVLLKVMGYGGGDA